MLIPPSSLVVLVGPAASGKSTFAARHFLPTQVVASDRCRALVGDDESDQAVSAQAFVLLHLLVRLRLSLGRITVVDSTALQPEHRRTLLRLARAFRVSAIAAVFDVDERICKRRNRQRERRVPDEVIALQCAQLRASLASIFSEGFESVYVLGAGGRESVEIASSS